MEGYVRGCDERVTEDVLGGDVKKGALTGVSAEGGKGTTNSRP